MPYLTYDTSVVISRRVTQFERLPGTFLMSAIVLLELTASASDGSQRKLYEKLFDAYRREKRLIVPNVTTGCLRLRFCFLLPSIANVTNGDD